jgi:hypothetical protein
VVGEIGVAGVAAGVHDGDGDAVTGEAGRTCDGGAHRVARRGVEELDRLVGVDVVGQARGDGRLHRGDGTAHDDEREVLHRLHLEAELLQRRDDEPGRQAVERGDARRDAVDAIEQAEARQVDDGCVRQQ